MSIRLSRNFTLSEMACSCGKCETSIEDIDRNLIYNLQKLRDSFGLPLRINSGYRCETHNKAVSGVPNSQHLLGKAADVSIKNFRSEDKYRLLQLIFRMNTFRGVGVYPTFIHLDVGNRENPTVWIGK